MYKTFAGKYKTSVERFFANTRRIKSSLSITVIKRER
jgi:hypothetical protein